MRLFKRNNKNAKMEQVWRGSRKAVDNKLISFANLLGEKINAWNPVLKWTALILFSLQWTAIIIMIVCTGTKSLVLPKSLDHDVTIKTFPSFDRPERKERNSDLYEAQQQLERCLDSLQVLYDSLQFDNKK